MTRRNEDASAAFINPGEAGSNVIYFVILDLARLA